MIDRPDFAVCWHQVTWGHMSASILLLLIVLTLIISVVRKPLVWEYSNCLGSFRLPVVGNKFGSINFHISIQHSLSTQNRGV